jgi:hypothetical protein
LKHIRVSYQPEAVCKQLRIDASELSLLKQMFHRGALSWNPDVPDSALLLLSLYSMLKQMGYDPKHILSILLNFRDPLENYGGRYAYARETDPVPICTLQIVDNCYVAFEVPEGHRRVEFPLHSFFNFKEGTVVTRIQTPVVLTSIVLPKLFWLSAAALQGLSCPRGEAAGQPAVQGS